MRPAMPLMTAADRKCLGSSRTSARDATRRRWREARICANEMLVAAVGVPTLPLLSEERGDREGMAKPPPAATVAADDDDRDNDRDNDDDVADDDDRRGA